MKTCCSVDHSFLSLIHRDNRINLLSLLCRHWLFEEFLSHDECVNLIKVHQEHVKKMKEIDPIICFDSIQTLRKHLKDLKPNTNLHLTPNDFTQG